MFPGLWYTSSCPFSWHCSCILFFRKWGTVHLIFYITNTRNLIHILLYLWYKEAFAHTLNKVVSAFYVFQMQSDAVAMSFIQNENKGEFMQFQDDQPQDDWHHWEEAVFLIGKGITGSWSNSVCKKTLRSHLCPTISGRSNLDQNITFSQIHAASPKTVSSLPAMTNALAELRFFF